MTTRSTVHLESPRDSYPDTTPAHHEGIRLCLESIPDDTLEQIVYEANEFVDDNVYSDLSRSPDADTDEIDEPDDAGPRQSMQSGFGCSDQADPPTRRRPPMVAWSTNNVGFVYHYIAGGFLRAVHIGVLYGVLLGSMQIDGNVYTTAQNLMGLPWALKVVFGTISDHLPVAGYRRRWYGVGGMAIVVVVHLVLVLVVQEPARDCGADCAHVAGTIVAGLLVANMGLALAESAGDGLLIECASTATSFARKSRLQVESLVLRMCGAGTGALFMALCFNSRRHLGFYDNDIGLRGVNTVCATVAAAACVGWACLCQAETLVPPVGPNTRRCSKLRRLRGHFVTTRNRVCTVPFCWFLVYQLLAVAMLSFTSPAVDLMRVHWAKVQQMQYQLRCSRVYLQSVVVDTQSRGRLRNG